MKHVRRSQEAGFTQPFMEIFALLSKCNSRAFSRLVVHSRLMRRRDVRLLSISASEEVGMYVLHHCIRVSGRIVAYFINKGAKIVAHFINDGPDSAGQS